MAPNVKFHFFAIQYEPDCPLRDDNLFIKDKMPGPKGVLYMKGSTVI